MASVLNRGHIRMYMKFGDKPYAAWAWAWAWAVGL